MYRVDFYNHDTGKHLKMDVEAPSMDEAFHIAYRRFKAEYRSEPYYCGYTDATTSEIPTGVSLIGVAFKYSGRWDGKSQVFIEADGEAAAIEVYNKTYKGKKFYQPWPDKINEEGNCVYGEVVETWYTA